MGHDVPVRLSLDATAAVTCGRSQPTRQPAVMTSEADKTTERASLVPLDPDGSPILIDQHVPKPQKQ
jgi:hypothetical protein